jgi:hypothetical protein
LSKPGGGYSSCRSSNHYNVTLAIDFASEVSETVEGQLWQAMRGLEESSLLLLEIGKHFKEIGRAGDAEAFLSRAKEVKERAQIVHDSVLRQKLISGDLKFDRRKTPIEAGSVTPKGNEKLQATVKRLSRYQLNVYSAFWFFLDRRIIVICRANAVSLTVCTA